MAAVGLQVLEARAAFNRVCALGSGLRRWTGCACSVSAIKRRKPENRSRCFRLS